MQFAALQTVQASAIVDRATLTSAFEAVETVIDARTSVPILANARITGHGDLMTVTGTNEDIEISVSFPAAADHGIDFTVPAKSLKTLLKGAPKADHVSMEPGGTCRTISSNMKENRIDRAFRISPDGGG